MACPVFHLTLISAEGLKDVNLVTKMAAYAIASLSNDPKFKQKTSVDKDGGKSPTWNFPMEFVIPTANPDGLVVHIQLKSKRTFGVSDVGEVHIPIPIKELLLEGTEKFVRCDVINPSGEPEGILNISYQIVEEVAPLQPLVTAYPSPQSASGYGAPPPQPPVTGYPAVVAGSNAYPSPQPAFGYAPQPQPPVTGYTAVVAGSNACPPPQSLYWYGAPPPQPPVTAYPAVVAGSNAYLPPQPAYGNGAPPPQPEPGYGYPPQPQHGYAKPKKNNFGMGLRAGLLAGDLVVGSISEMISDAGDSVFDV